MRVRYEPFGGIVVLDRVFDHIHVSLDGVGDTYRAVRGGWLRGRRGRAGAAAPRQG